MAVLYILVKFIVLSFYHNYYFYFQAYHSRYITGDCEFYAYTCKCSMVFNIEKKLLGKYYSETREIL